VLIIYPPVRFGSVDNNGLNEKAGLAGDSLGAVGNLAVTKSLLGARLDLSDDDCQLYLSRPVRREFAEVP
jgi:hypothetical protein